MTMGMSKAFGAYTMEERKRLAIVFNGPPRAGKDTAILVLESQYPKAEVYQFIRPVKEKVHRDLGLEVAFDHFERSKDIPLEVFGGLAPRYAYIAESDRLVEELGPDILTDMYFHAISSCNADILITSCGKNSEAEKLASIFGVDNTLFVRVNRAGHDYSKDVREWITVDGLNIRDVHNEDGKLREFQSEVAAVVADFVAQFQNNLTYAA
jgi:hypothetical protein